jgi:hypothetical protein
VGIALLVFAWLEHRAHRRGRTAFRAGIGFSREVIPHLPRYLVTEVALPARQLPRLRAIA